MRIKLDENVPDRAVASLAALGHDIDTLAGEGLGGATDQDLWPKVQEACLVIVSDHKVRVRRPRS